MTKKRFFRLSLVPACLGGYAVVIRATVGLVAMTSLPPASAYALSVLVPVVIAALVLKKLGWM